MSKEIPNPSVVPSEWVEPGTYQMWIVLEEDEVNTKLALFHRGDYNSLAELGFTGAFINKLIQDKQVVMMHNPGEEDEFQAFSKRFIVEIDGEEE